MSNTYEIACMDCKEILWIGQSGSYPGILYDDEFHRLALTRFLFAHETGEKTHHLLFYELDKAVHGYADGWKYVIVPDSEGTYRDNLNEDEIRFDHWLMAKYKDGVLR
jgi:hypothetical protein